ncbi:MAG TPA: S41 family peptidase [Gemmatimonadales bacterium]|jgi:carboxyl-terminal processing protease|nr:S41 family peptidase [Gemmatimonadales bacterium]
MKHRLGALALVAVLSFISGGWLLHREPAAEGNLYQQARILETVLSVIHDHSLIATDQRELFQNTARTLVGQLKDPYAELLVGDGYRQFNRQMSGTGEVGPATAEPGALVGRAVRVPAISPGLLLDQATGYVALHTLSDGSVDELAAAIWDLRKRGMRSLVLDLRNNPGGLIKQGVQVAELFLNKGDTVVITRGRTAAHSKVYVADEAQRWPGLNLVLLVNDGTASSAELIAGALQDHDRAAIIGTPTYGKGVLQTTYPLGSEMAIKLTTARWFTPSGRTVNRPRTHSDSVLARQRDAALAGGARFRTPMGRPLPDGAGIVPDLMVRRDGYTPGERAFLDSLGSSYAAFRSALEECAERARGNADLVSESFEVTPAMRAEVRAALAERGVAVSPQVMDGAAGYVDRQLGYEIARTLFGDAASIRRRLLDDRQMRTAMDLLQRDLSQPDLIRAAEQSLD